MDKIYKVLIIEDDLVISNTIRTHLNGWGFDVYVLEDFYHVSERVQVLLPDLVLLDIGLPFFNGFHWCSEIRKFSKVPIIFISSANDNLNIVMAVNMGGDDFIAKPFDLNVLTAKIQALIRRTYEFTDSNEILERDGAILNIGGVFLTYKDKDTHLTKNELRIMQVLMENAGKVVPRETLMLRLWESDNFVDENTLTVNINRLRKKLMDAGLSNFIKTKKGIGYEIE